MNYTENKMKRLIFFIIACPILSAVALAQMPDPAKYHLIYGNRDGSPLLAQLGAIIEVPIWGATDPTPGNTDTVMYMMNPLDADARYVTQRNGGFGETVCDTFLAPVGNSQTHARFGFGNAQCGFFTGGDTVLIATFRMRVSNDISLIGQTVCPFTSGDIGIWGMQDGVRNVIPTQTYGCLYFVSLCDYLSGDFNNDGAFNGVDIVYGINCLKGLSPIPEVTCDCQPVGHVWINGDINGDCAANGLDIVYGINYLKGMGPAPRRCPACP
jgi:hypothetical protein